MADEERRVSFSGQMGGESARRPSTAGVRFGDDGRGEGGGDGGQRRPSTAGLKRQDSLGQKMGIKGLEGEETDNKDVKERVIKKKNAHPLETWGPSGLQSSWQGINARPNSSRERGYPIIQDLHLASTANAQRSTHEPTHRSSPAPLADVVDDDDGWADLGAVPPPMPPKLRLDLLGMHAPGSTRGIAVKRDALDGPRPGELSGRDRLMASGRGVGTPLHDSLLASPARVQSAGSISSTPRALRSASNLSFTHGSSLPPTPALATSTSRTIDPRSLPNDARPLSPREELQRRSPTQGDNYRTSPRLGVSPRLGGAISPRENLLDDHLALTRSLQIRGPRGAAPRPPQMTPRGVPGPKGTPRVLLVYSPKKTQRIEGKLHVNDEIICRHIGGVDQSLARMSLDIQAFHAYHLRINEPLPYSCFYKPLASPKVDGLKRMGTVGSSPRKWRESTMRFASRGACD